MKLHYVWTPSGPRLKPPHPEQIKAALRMKGVTPSALADKLGVANSTMSQVISGRSVSARIRQQIALVTGIPVEKLWPPIARPTLRRIKQPQDQVVGSRA